MGTASDTIFLSTSEFAMETSVHRSSKAVTTAEYLGTATPGPYAMYAVYGGNFPVQPLRYHFLVFLLFFST